MSELFLRALVALLIAIGAHLAYLRMFGQEKFVARAYAVGAMVFLAAAATFFQDGFLAGCVTAFLYVSLLNLYLTALINFQNSFSLRILAVVGESGATREDLDRAFPDERSFEARIMMMRARGFVQRDGAKVWLTRPGRKFAEAVVIVRRVLGVRSVG